MDKCRQDVLPLTVERVSILQRDAVNREATIKSFVDSQTRYLANHMLEGLKAANTWEDSVTKESQPSRPTHKKEGQSSRNPDRFHMGFSSPILRPRQDVLNAVPIVHDRTVKDVSKKPSVARTSKGKEDDFSFKDNEMKSPQRTTRDIIDDEHRKRLEERRDRRRTKRAIVVLNATSEYSVARGQEKDAAKLNVSRMERKGSKKGAKEGKNKGNITGKLPAGLALMHGFSAANVGKSRLTAALTTVNGVFSKGKASKKSKIDDCQRTKARAAKFDESNFLDHHSSHSSTRSTSSGDTQSKDSGANGGSALYSRATLLSPKNGNKSFKTNNGMLKRKRSSSLLSKTSVQQSERSFLSKSNYESEVWDIESHLTNEPSVDEAKQTACNSVVIDCNSRQWHASVEQSTADAGYQRRSISHDSRRSNGSSICPSHSASHLQTNKKGPSLPQSTSRYFEDAARPPAVIKVNEAQESLYATSPLHRSGDINDRPDSVEETIEQMGGSALAVHHDPGTPVHIVTEGNLRDLAMHLHQTEPTTSELLCELQGSVYVEYQNATPANDDRHSPRCALVDGSGDCLPAHSFLEVRGVDDVLESLTYEHIPLECSEGEDGVSTYWEPGEAYQAHSSSDDFVDLEEAYFHVEQETYDMTSVICDGNGCASEDMEHEYVSHGGDSSDCEPHAACDEQSAVSEAAYDAFDGRTSFLQGRALLLGFDEEELAPSSSRRREKREDVDAVQSVAMNLRNHWHPVKF